MKKIIKTFSARAAMMLLATLLLTMTAQTAWAQGESLPAPDGNGNVTLKGGDYIVNSNVTISGNITANDPVSLTITNGATLSVGGYIYSYELNLTILSGSKLSLESMVPNLMGSVNIQGGTINGQGCDITVNNTFNMNGGTVNVNGLIFSSGTIQNNATIEAYSVNMPVNATISGSTIVSNDMAANGVTFSGSDVTVSNKLSLFGAVVFDASSPGVSIKIGVYDNNNGSTLTISNGSLTDGQNIYTGAIANPSVLNGKTLTYYNASSAITVSLNWQGGSGGTESVTPTAGEAMPTITPPTRTGYTFGGYYTETNGGGTQIYKADGTSEYECDFTGTVTLYAKWTAKTYTVTLDRQGGSGGPASVTATYGSAMLAITPPTRTYYEFGGYYTETNGGGVKYYNADGTSAGNWVIDDANATLYAYWKKYLSNEDITIEIPAQTYNGSMQTPVVTVKDNGSVVSDEHYTITLPDGRTNAGDYTINIEAKEGSTAYVGATPATFTITPKAVTITASSDSKTYDGTALTKDTYTNTALAEGDHIESVTVAGSRTYAGTSNNVPSAAVIKNSTDEDVTANYNITYANGTLTVTRMEVTITADSDMKEYDGTPLTNDSYTSTPLAEGDHIESVTVAGSQTDAGTSDNVPSDVVIMNSNDEDVTANYDITYVNGTLTVIEIVSFEIDGITYKWKSETNTFKVTACNGTSSSLTILSSVEYNGVLYNVTEIGEGAFEGNDVLEAIEMTNCLITVIGRHAFKDCTNLSEIRSIPASLRIIEEEAFRGSGLIEFTIPDGVERIEDYAFSNCSNLTSVTIPASVTDVGENVFEGCNGDLIIYVPEGRVNDYRSLWPDAIILAEGTIPIPYIAADGSQAYCTDYTVLDGSETSLSAGWYVVNSDINYTGTITLTGDVAIILSDGKTMTIGTNNQPIEGQCISGVNFNAQTSYSLTVYGQSGQSGSLNAYKDASTNTQAVIIKNYTQHGGNVIFDSGANVSLCIYKGNLTLSRGSLIVNNRGSSAAIDFYENYHLYMSGGTLTTSSDSYGVDFTTAHDGDITFTGGNFTSNGEIRGGISLNWNSYDDSFYAQKYNGPVTIVEGKEFYDRWGDEYSGTLTDYQKYHIENNSALSAPESSVTASGTTTIYGTLQTALNTAPDGSTVKPLRNVNLYNSDLYFSPDEEDISVILDLNGKTISGGLISNSGTMTIIDSSNGEGAITAPDDYSNAIVNSNNLTITSGKISGGYKCIDNNDYATLTINGGNIIAKPYGIENDGTLIVNGGTISAEGVPADPENYYDSDKPGIAIINYSILTINGGTISAEGIAEESEYPGKAILNDGYGTLTVIGGRIENSGIGIDNCSDFVLTGLPTFSGNDVDIFLTDAYIDFTEDISSAPTTLIKLDLDDTSYSFTRGYASHCVGFPPSRMFEYVGNKENVFVGHDSQGEGKTREGYRLMDDSDNSSAIDYWKEDGNRCYVQLYGRTFYRNGDWNTLCLPFSLTADQIANSNLEGAIIKELNTSESNLDSNGQLTLTFAPATADDSDNIIKAGKPYIVKWDAEENLVNIIDPIFTNVKISVTEPVPVSFDNAKGSDCQFVGQFSPFAITESNKDEIVMLGSGSQLGYSKNTRDLKCFRAHFLVPANSGVQQARAFVVDFGDEETTGIVSMDNGRWIMDNEAGAWFTLDGRKLGGQPTKKGVYIQNGKKVVIK